MKLTSYIPYISQLLDKNLFMIMKSTSVAEVAEDISF